MKKILCGNEMDRMPDWAFRIMAFMFKLADVLKSPANRLDPFGIQKGQTVIDYGCGTGRYLKQASHLVGETGRVYGVDIQPLAVKAAAGIAEKNGLTNITPLLTDGKTVGLPEHTADIIYALDMFHMVSDSQGFLQELRRLTRPGGYLFLEDGHQPRVQTRAKVTGSGCWEIVEEHKNYLKCSPSVPVPPG